MALHGHYEHSLDSKDRLTVPARYRAALADGVVLAAGLDPCVEVYAPDAFADFEKSFLAPLNPFSGDARDMRRFFYGHSFEEKLDSAGRLRLPRLLIEHAGIEGPCAVIGAGNHLEVWSAETWAERDPRIRAEASEKAESLANAHDH